VVAVGDDDAVLMVASLSGDPLGAETATHVPPVFKATPPRSEDIAGNYVILVNGVG
jgi:hypothetical protein